MGGHMRNTFLAIFTCFLIAGSAPLALAADATVKASSSQKSSLTLDQSVRIIMALVLQPVPSDDDVCKSGQERPGTSFANMRSLNGDLCRELRNNSLSMRAIIKQVFGI